LHLTNVLVSGVAMFAKKITDINTDKLSKFVEIGLLNVEEKNSKQFLKTHYHNYHKQ
jgi:hypothetical protein